MKAIDEIELLGTIIENNYCSGCGVCTAATNSNFKMSLTENGNYQPILFNEKEKTTTTVCPFADHGFDEDDIAKERFSQIENIKYSDKIGYYYGLYAGHVETDNYRLKGSSGGSVSWLTSALIEEGLVDYVVHVKEAKNEEVFFEYAVSSSIEEIKEGAKSRYYPVSMDKVLNFVKENDARYLIIGVPCFVKAIHLLKKKEKIFNDRILYTASLFCGHLKTTHYLESIVSQFEVDKNEIDRFDFRHKIKGRNATDYGTEITLKNGEKKVKLNTELFGN